MKILLLALAVLAIATAGVLLRPQAQPVALPELVQVRRGTVAHHQHELGELEAVDAVPVPMPVKGRLEWLLEDGVAVRAGDRLAVVNEDEALAEVLELRGQELAAEQEVDLARLRQAQAATEEQRKVAAAARELELAQYEHRIRSGTPQGEARFLELHAQLLPLEARIDEVRRAGDAARAAWREADAAYRAADDAWQEQADAELRQRTRADELTVRLAAETDLDATRRVELEAERDAALAEAEAARGQLPELAATRLSLRDAATAATAPLAAADAALAEAEAAALEPALAMEIEKRGLEAARLAIDQEIALLDLAEAEAELEQGHAARRAGAASDARVMELEAKLAEARTALAILEERLAIARRPPPDEQIVESRLALERAAAAMDKAEQVRARALEKVQVDLEVQLAELAKVRQRLADLAAGFPAAIRATIGYLEERQAAAEEERVRQDLAQRLSTARAELATAEATPPNVVLAPVDGVLRLGRKDDRSVQVGDELDRRELLCEVRPPTGMQVLLAVNEGDLTGLAVGMPATARILALPDREYAGRITALGGAGRDKMSGLFEQGAAAAGVTVFDCRVALDAVAPDLLQGMSVLVTIERGRRVDCLHMPHTAVRATGDGVVALRPDGSTVPVTGSSLGPEVFVVEAGLTEGEQVRAVAEP